MLVLDPEQKLSHFDIHWDAELKRQVCDETEKMVFMYKHILIAVAYYLHSSESAIMNYTGMVCMSLTQSPTGALESFSSC
jgi:hypothetical protein